MSVYVCGPVEGGVSRLTPGEDFKSHVSHLQLVTHR